MIRYFLVLITVGSLCCHAQCAELLVRAFERPIDRLTADSAQALGHARRDFFSRPRKGNIVRVESDGFAWGKKERLPRFVLIKLPDVPVDTVREYARSKVDSTVARDNTGQFPMLFEFGYRIPGRIVDSLVALGGVVSISMGKVRIFIQKRTKADTTWVE